MGSRALSVCNDCLCLMALFRAVMSLAHHWAEWSVWTGTDAGYCRTITWEERYLPRLHPPCVVDRLCGYRTCVLLAGFGLSLQRVSEHWPMATEGAALVEPDRAGITFGVELYVPWDAPEAVVDISSEGVVPLRSIPDVIGLTGRRADAVECRILQGRVVRSVWVLVPEPRGLDQNFHDVTIFDMGDVPESSVSIPDLSSLSQQWPPAVISHMGWLQQEL